MKIKKTLVLLTSAVMTLGAFSGCSLEFNKAKDLSVNTWGTPVEAFDYVAAVKKAVEKQGYTAEIDEYGDGMYELNCYEDDIFHGVDISFSDGKIETITYTYDIDDVEAVDSNIQTFKDHVAEYSEMLDKVSKNTSLELWPVSDIYSDSVYFEMYRENTDRSTYVYNGRYDFSFFNHEYSKTMNFKINPDDESSRFDKGFYDEDESTDTLDDDSDTGEDNTDTSDGKTGSYEEFKEKMYEVFDEGYGTDSMTLQDELNILTITPMDTPNNRIIFDVANDGTINSVSYEYGISGEVSDDNLPEETNTFISDITAKALESGYDIPLLKSDLDESAFEKYSEDKSQSYEYELEKGRAELVYYTMTDERPYPVFFVSVLNNQE